MTARGAAGRCPPTVSGGAARGWGWSSDTLPPCAGCQGAPAAEAPGGPGCRGSRRAPVTFPSLRASGPAAPGVGAETAAALRCSRGRGASLGKGGYLPGCKEGHTEPPAGRREGSRRPPRLSLLKDLPPRDGHSGCGAFPCGHLPHRPAHAWRPCWGVGASGWRKFRDPQLIGCQGLRPGTAGTRQSRASP